MVTVKWKRKGKCMDTALFFFFTGAYLFLLVWALGRQREWNSMSVLYLVLLGLIYDNAIIAVGRFIGEGALLENLSIWRFWSHAFFTPLLALFAWGTLHHAGVEWARKKAVFYGALLFTAALVVLEIVLETWGLVIEPVWEYGVLRYTSAEEGGGPPVMVLLVIVPLLAAGAVLWKRIGWKWMLVGAVLMTIGSAVPIPIESSAATNAFELILLFTLVLTKIRVERYNGKRTQ